jgi:hypothetical protein
MNRINSILVPACVFALAGCGQAEQKIESSGQQTNTPTETATSTTTGNDGSSNKAYEGTISGVISDSMCGKDHSGMGELGKDPVACTTKCVEQGAKYVLVSDSGDVYRLTDTSQAKGLAGKPVSIEGHIDPKEKAIHVHSIAAK